MEYLLVEIQASLNSLKEILAKELNKLGINQGKSRGDAGQHGAQGQQQQQKSTVVAK